MSISPKDRAETDLQNLCKEWTKSQGMGSFLDSAELEPGCPVGPCKMGSQFILSWGR